jgi:peroxiredoxin
MKKFVIVIVSLSTLLIVLLAIYHKELESLRPYKNPDTISDNMCILTGHLDGCGISTLGLSYESDSGRKFIHIEQHHGDFIVKLKIKEPGCAYISYNQFNWLPRYGKRSNTVIILEPGAVIYIEGRADSLHNIRVIGSPIYTQIDSLNKAVHIRMQKDFDDSTIKIKEQHTEEFNAIFNLKDTVLKKKKWQEYSDKYYNTALSDDKYYLEFIKTHPGSVVSALILGRLYDFWDPNEYMKAYESLDSNIRELSYAKAFRKKIEALAKTQVGMQAPDITLPDADGRPVSLSSFRGKATLLEFWASYAPNCQLLCPKDFVGVYKQYHQKGFEIYAVAIGRNKKQWLETIKKDTLSWTNVQDTGAYQKYISTDIYGTWPVSRNVLIDKDGKILARDIKSFKLKEKLTELLK